MWLKEIPSPIALNVCMICFSERARWTGMWPSRVRTMCYEHLREWQRETL